jgi:hypothetical protein
MNKQLKVAVRILRMSEWNSHVGSESTEWKQLAQGATQWWVIVNAVINIHLP